MTNYTRLIPLLEKMKDMLGVTQDGPGTQSKPAQSNRASTSAAKTKLDNLTKMSKAGKGKDLEIDSNAD